jgi:hypothetical protein
MTKGRAVLPGTVVAEQEPFFITLGAPEAHDFSGRDDKGKVGAPMESSYQMEAPLKGRRAKRRATTGASGLSNPAPT